MDEQLKPRTFSTVAEADSNCAFMGSDCRPHETPPPKVSFDLSAVQSPCPEGSTGFLDYGNGNIFQYDPFAAPQFGFDIGNQYSFAMPEDFVQYLFHGMQSNPSDIASVVSWQGPDV